MIHLYITRCTHTCRIHVGMSDWHQSTHFLIKGKTCCSALRWMRLCGEESFMWGEQLVTVTWLLNFNISVTYYIVYMCMCTIGHSGPRMRHLYRGSLSHIEPHATMQTFLESEWVVWQCSYSDSHTDVFRIPVCCDNAIMVTPSQRHSLNPSELWHNYHMSLEAGPH